MSNHFLLMSFNGNSFLNLNKTMTRFFDYTFSLLQTKKTINFCYIGTAANDRLLERLFFHGFIRCKFGSRVHFSKLLLAKKYHNENQIENQIIDQDILFIGGGNTEQMLKTWEGKGFTHVLNKLKDENRLPILTGVSAGGMYPFHSGLTDSTPGQYRALPCLGWFTQSFCAHSDSTMQALCAYADNKQLNRLTAYQTAIKFGHLPSGYAVPDDCMLHFYNFNFVRALSSHKNKKCFFVTPEKIEAIETLHLTSANSISTPPLSLLQHPAALYVPEGIIKFKNYIS